MLAKDSRCWLVQLVITINMDERNFANRNILEYFNQIELCKCDQGSIVCDYQGSI